MKSIVRWQLYNRKARRMGADQGAPIVQSAMDRQLRWHEESGMQMEKVLLAMKHAKGQRRAGL